MRKLFIFLFFVFGFSFLFAGEVLNHSVKVEVVPEKHFVMVTDTITLPDDFSGDTVSFLLHKGMDLICITKQTGIEKSKDIDFTKFNLDESPKDVQVEKYIVKLSGRKSFTVQYTGEIFHPVKQLAEKYARGFSETPGTVEKQGIYLSRSSFWLPYFKGDLVTFQLKTILPKDWDSVSQGKRVLHKVEKDKKVTKWEVKNPTDDIFFCGAKFFEFKTQVGNVDILAFLRSNDENLANKYLETTGQYLKMYESLIGKFPYSKFALVENFLETGYGMPSFTLLGPQIIRFPFILHSSYPHELLHNWWGNSVYVDYESGNWCEGLTVYLADHLIKEQRGQGVAYRRATLQKFTDFVNPDNDFPLTKFLNRYNASSEAIGYGKSMMMFNMLREKLGDENFIKGLQLFYKENKFKKASFSDICNSFEKVSNSDLKPFFKQWTTKKGAPKLNLTNLNLEKVGDKFKLSFKIAQKQKENFFNISIPIYISFENEKFATKKVVQMVKNQQLFSFEFDKKPTFVEVDPAFNVMRKLDPMEVPPALSKVLGAKKITIILPSNGKNVKSYEKLANIWAKDRSKNIETVVDKDLKKLPANSCWIFGFENKFMPIIKQGVKQQNVSFENDFIRFGKQKLEKKDKSVVVAARNPENSSSAVVLLAIGNEKAVSGLSRKLLHYGKYGYLVFEGSEPSNILKGMFNPINSPLSKPVVENGVKGQVKVRKPLITLPPVFSKKQMGKHLSYLASEQLEGRGFGSKGLEKAGAYIANKFKQYGLQQFDGSYVQQFEAVCENKKAKLKNIVGVIKGTNPKYEGQVVVLGAHYDHLGFGFPDCKKGNKGKIHFGADDNASGVSVLLELARILGNSFKPERTLVFVAFSGEECGLKGSKHFVPYIKDKLNKKVTAMVNLDTVGRLENKKLMVIGGNSSPLWKHIFMGTSYVTGVDTVLVTEDLDSSDQQSFIAQSIPAIQLFSGPNVDYHKPTDTVDKIDYNGLVKVATVTKEVVSYLCKREEPLPFKGQKVKQVGKHSKKGKNASTGVIPDFAFSGKGVGVSGTVPNSPAKKVGILKGDVITAVNGKAVSGLRDYSNILRQFKPGDKIKLNVVRGGKTLEIELMLTER